MSNMSYCRFENTLSDMYDCLNAMRNGEAGKDSLSESELKARDEMFRVCEDMMSEILDLEDSEEAA